ncbi:MAG: orotidine-5'-phosphate decarboxylase [Armatimonadota bacterium]|nr:MAG: orotidine-5'-phosphate decarboxylase [Armatimonadota bacterium]
MARSRPKLIVALDFPALSEAREVAEKLAGLADVFKVGLELFSAEGPGVLRAIADIAGPVFYDAKLLDIPNTVAGAAGSITAQRVAMFNVHAMGGREVMSAAVRAAAHKAEELGIERPRVVGVTVLTSMDDDDLREAGVARPMREQVVALALSAREAGLDGVVASPQEIGDVRAACGSDFLVVTPGVRPTWASRGDQKRVMTPGEAAEAGADYVVVGRPITQAPDPAAAAMRISQELAGS